MERTIRSCDCCGSSSLARSGTTTWVVQFIARPAHSVSRYACEILRLLLFSRRCSVIVYGECGWLGRELQFGGLSTETYFTALVLILICKLAIEAPVSSRESCEFHVYKMVQVQERRLVVECLVLFRICYSSTGRSLGLFLETQQGCVVVVKSRSRRWRVRMISHLFESLSPAGLMLTMQMNMHQCL